MPFERPTLAELIARNEADVATRLPGADTKLRRGNLTVLPRVHAGAVHGLYGLLDYMSRQLMPDTAEAEYLERHASFWGITRKPAAKASGVLKLTGNDGAVIPAGAVFRRNDQARFVATAEATIAAGAASVNVEAETAGAAGNTDAATPLTLVSPLSGVNNTCSVDTDGFSGGADAESDVSLLARVLRRVQQPPNGGADADYVTWALEMPGVTRAWATAHYLGLGTVGLIFVMDDKPGGIIPDAGEVAAMQAYIDERRPVTAQVTVLAPTPVALDFTIALSPDTSTVRAAVEAELADLIAREAEPGGTLLISHIREAISTAAGETDHVLTAPAADVTVAAGEVTTMGTITWS